MNKLSLWALAFVISAVGLIVKYCGKLATYSALIIFGVWATLKYKELSITKK